MLFLVILLFPLATSAEVCHPSSKKLLIHFKNQLNPPSENIEASWKPDTDCCLSWYGVNCNDHGYVSSIQFNTPNIYGPIPKALCDFVNMTNVNIEFSNMVGEIPECIGHLTMLQGISITDNIHVTGPIPKSIGQLPVLENLFLYNNSLTGSIPSELGQSRSLTDITLNKNQLNGSIPASLANIPTLYILDLSENLLTGKIPESFSSLKNKIYLDLSRNRLRGSIPTSLVQASIGYFDLSSNNFHGDASFLLSKGYTKIADSNFKFNLSNVVLPDGLQEFNISHNSIYGSLPEKLGTLPLRRHPFDVSHNRLTGPIPTGLQNFSSASFAHNDCLCGPPLPSCEKGKCFYDQCVH